MKALMSFTDRMHFVLFNTSFMSFFKRFWYGLRYRKWTEFRIYENSSSKRHGIILLLTKEKVSAHDLLTGLFGPY